jgi:hypothetical protein
MDKWMDNFSILNVAVREALRRRQPGVGRGFDKPLLIHDQAAEASAQAAMKTSTAQPQ